MPQQQQKPGGASKMDNFIGIVLLLALIFGGWVFVQKNDIHSVNDFLIAARGSGEKITKCGESEDIVDCLGNAFSNKAPGVKPTDAPQGSALSLVDSMKIAEPDDSEYNRGDYKHWIKQEGQCDTRETALKEQGTDVVVDNKCKATSGQWTDWYSGETMTDASGADLDHVIPLGYANAHGGAAWDKQKKQDFANDLSQLLVVGASENRSKSDKGPSDYMPPNESYHCEYADKWVKTALKYDLSVTEKDKKVLQDTLSHCPA